MATTVTNLAIAYQTDADNTVYATWECSASHVDHYTVQWYYDTGDSTWFDGGSSDVTLKNATYSPPTNARHIRVDVTPVSTTYTSNGNTKSYWTGTKVRATIETSWYTVETSSSSTLKYVTITAFDYQTGEDNTVYATWTFSESKVDHYTVHWYYDTGDSTWFDGGSSDVTLKNATYSPPDSARRIRVDITPVSTTYTSGGVELSYWEGGIARSVISSTWYTISTSSSSLKYVTITNFEFQSNLDNTAYVTWTFSESHVDHYTVQWYYDNGAGTWFDGGSSDVTLKNATYSPPDNTYRVRVDITPVSTSATYWTGGAVKSVIDVPWYAVESSVSSTCVCQIKM